VQHPDPFSTQTTVLPDELLPGTWSEPGSEPGSAGEPFPVGRGRHQAPLTGPDGIPLSFTDQLLEPVVGWWRGIREAVVAADRRLLIGAVVLVPTLAVFGAVALLPGSPSGPVAAVTPAPKASPSAAASTPAAATVGQLSALTADQTAALMARAGVGITGTPDQAWTFHDRNGLNLLVATVEPTTGQDSTLRVALLGRMDGSAVTLTRLADSGLPGCGPRGNADHGNRGNQRHRRRTRPGNGDGGQNQAPQPEQSPAPAPTPVAAAGFTIDSVTLADHDRDGLGEVSIGWSSACGDPGTTPSRAQLALITGSRTFLLHGEGVVGSGAASGAGSGSASGAAPTAEPAATSWPAGSFEPTSALFHQLYF
jgi:hypothetical protein